MGWVPIALGRDVPKGTTRAAIVEGKELVIWRGGDGTAHVWEDRCPHRGMRLSFGFVRENALNCLYHGWQYGAGASCQRIPAHPDLTVPPTIRANAYEAAEAGGMVWVRLGDEGEFPTLPEGTPVASLAVETSSFEEPPLFALPVEDATMHVGWHRVSENKVMLHGVIEPGGNVAAALRALRDLRKGLERDVAA
jgi:phenylpropionate dioxygenase-like ring-hydroxylating dioxygenase large terminal subunit